jgi:5'(3')-deoxyribonucleotidase
VYVRQGAEILTKDRGILSSYGYYDVEKQTVKYRRLALLEATQYLSKDYIQERLYFIAKMRSGNSVFWDDLEWFERTFQLVPYSD